METDTNQFLADRYKVLPEELQKFIMSEGLSRKVQLVAKKYRLSDDQERILHNETVLVLLVLDSVDALHLNIEESLGLAPALAENLALDIVEYVFKGVDQYLAHTQAELLIPESYSNVPLTLKPEEATALVFVAPQIPVQQAPAQPIQKEIFQTSTIRQQAPIIQPQPQQAPYQDSLNKHDILHEIENPPRTVIKKYVLEHEPITDPEHLIDDSIDARTKLEDHYSN